jgi:2-iminobutanoate/2-iminopropanoate deaminase
MQRRIIASHEAPAAQGGYAQAVEVTNATRWLYVSGQVPTDRSGEAPVTFAEQCRLAWANVDAQLRAAGMSMGNLVKVTIFLGDRRYAMENRAIRQEVLGGHAPALTVIITGIFDSAWHLEIEAVAAA